MLHYQSFGTVTKFSQWNCLRKKIGREKCSLGLPNAFLPTELRNKHAGDCNALDLHSFPPFRVEKSGDQEHCSPLLHNL